MSILLKSDDLDRYYRKIQTFNLGIDSYLDKIVNELRNAGLMAISDEEYYWSPVTEQSDNNNVAVEIQNGNIPGDIIHIPDGITKFTIHCSNKSLKVTGGKDLITAYRMFESCTHLKHLDISELNLSELVNAYSMFSGCEDLVDINFGGSCRANNIRTTNRMFMGCKSLESINLEFLKNSEIINMSDMFTDCERLKSVNVNICNLSKVRDISSMFARCFEIESIDLSNLTGGNLQATNDMFRMCEKLQYLDLSHLSLDSVIALNVPGYYCDMLYGCKMLHPKNIKIHFRFMDYLYE